MLTDDKLFESQADAEQFVRELHDAFSAIMDISAIGSLGASTGPNRAKKAALFARLLAMMVHYKAEQAMLNVRTRPDADREHWSTFDQWVEEVWPTLKAKLDKDMEASREVVDLIRSVLGARATKSEEGPSSTR